MSRYKFTNDEVSIVPLEKHSPKQWARYLRIPYYYFKMFIDKGAITVLQDEHGRFYIEGEEIKRWMTKHTDGNKFVYRIAEPLSDSQVEQISSWLAENGYPSLVRLNKPRE